MPATHNFFNLENVSIHLTIWVIKCDEGNDFAKTAHHILSDSIPQKPSPDSQKLL